MLQVYQETDSRTEEYQYDLAGNRKLLRVTLAQTLDYNSQYYTKTDRLKTDGKYAFVYDKAGNMVKKGNVFVINEDTVSFTKTSGEEVEYWEYKYDLLNRLIEVTKNGNIVAEYAYDPEGLRVVKKAKGETTHYVFQGTEPLFEKKISTGKIKSFVYALGKHLARVDGAIGDTKAKQYWYVTDHLGSVRAVTDVDGKKVWSADYLAFGTQFGKDAATDFEELHSFTGKELDPDTGLHYYNARWYDSELGRFISEDPVADPNNPNLYSYGRNNPLGFVDPTGLYGYDSQTGQISHPDGTITDTSGNTISTPPGGSNPGYAHGGGPISSYQSVRTSTNIPGVNYSFSIAVYSEDVSVTTETYTNEEGASVTVTTTERGNVTEQTVTVTDKDGNSKTETLSYVNGIPVHIEDQRNVIAVDDFVTGAKKYRAIVVVVGKEEGAVGAWQGSTKPNKSSYAEIVEGVYEMTKGKHYSKYGNESDENGSYYWAAILNNNEPIDTTNENPRHNNQKWANYIHFHSGFSDISNGSEGCLTIRPGKGNYPNGSNWSSFYDAIGGNEANEGNYIGSVYVSRL